MKRNLVAALMGLSILIGSAPLAMAGSGAGAIVLSFPPGARFNALGEAGVALSQDATANWFNPGGLAFMENRGGSNLQFMYSKLAEGLADDIRLFWGGYAAGFEGGGYGFSFTYLNMGEQVATDEQGQERGTFNSYEFAIQGAMAFKLSENAGLGLGAKYFRDKLADDSVLQDRAGGSGDSYGVDIGLMYKIRQYNVNLAAVASNLGFNNEIKHVDEDQADPMPRKFTIGGVWAPEWFMSENFMAIVVADYQLPLYKWDEEDNDYGWGFEKDQEEFGYGLELNLVNVFAPRIGWKSAKYGDINGLTWGFGFDLSTLIDQNLQFAFASVPQADGLDSVKRFSMNFSW
jgi:hypothetical protein